MGSRTRDIANESQAARDHGMLLGKIEEHSLGKRREPSGPYAAGLQRSARPTIARVETVVIAACLEERVIESVPGVFNPELRTVGRMSKTIVDELD